MIQFVSDFVTAILPQPLSKNVLNASLSDTMNCIVLIQLACPNLLVASRADLIHYSDRMQLFIQCSKGKKDRYVNLSPVLLDVLRAYISESKTKPVKYLFESQQPAIAYCTRSAQKVFQNAKNLAGIKKEVSFHVLRHSFATHLLEKGIDVIYIKDILGHFNIKTTERYLHVRKEQLVTIISPLDDLWKKGGIEI